MNKKTLTVILLSTVLFFPMITYAAVDSIQSLLVALLTVIWQVFAAIVVVCFIVSGVLFLTAQGDPGKLQKARSALIFGIVGIVVGILAFSIIGIITNVLQ